MAFCPDVILEGVALKDEITGLGGAFGAAKSPQGDGRRRARGDGGGRRDVYPDRHLPRQLDHLT